MRLFIPSRVIRLTFFTLVAGVAGFISAEATAMTLCFLMILAACCRHPIRLELVFAGAAAFAARRSGGDFSALQASLSVLLPLVVALCGLSIMSRGLFGPQEHHLETRRPGRNLWQ